MRPPGNASRAALIAGGTQKLKQKPESQKKISRDFNKQRDEQDGDQGQYPGFGEKQKIGAHNAGNGAAGADGRDVGIQIQQQMGQAGCHSAEKIKHQVPQGAQAILDIVAKNIQEPHVAEKMPEPAVEKHKGNQGKKLLAGAEVGCDVRHKIAGRHQAIRVDEPVRLPAEGHLEQINQYIHSDNDRVGRRIIL